MRGFRIDQERAGGARLGGGRAVNEAWGGESNGVATRASTASIHDSCGAIVGAGASPAMMQSGQWNLPWRSPDGAGTSGEACGPPWVQMKFGMRGVFGPAAETSGQSVPHATARIARSATGRRGIRIVRILAA